MAKVELLSPIILKWEGGFQNMKEDRGNYLNGILIGTNKGITPAAYQTAFKKIPTVEDMKNLSREQFSVVLKSLYWDKACADQIENQSIANIIVDWLWGSGVGMLRKIQKIVNVVPDGIAGQRTVNAINNYPQEVLFDKIKQERIFFVHDIVNRRPNQIKFLKGWLNRINSYTFTP